MYYFDPIKSRPYDRVKLRLRVGANLSGVLTIVLIGTFSVSHDLSTSVVTPLHPLSLNPETFFLLNNMSCFSLCFPKSTGEISPVNEGLVSKISTHFKKK